MTDFEGYHVEKALHSSGHNVKSEGGRGSAEKGREAGLFGSMAAKLVWRSINE